MIRKKYAKKTKMKCKESQGKNKTSKLVYADGAFHGSYSCLKNNQFHMWDSTPTHHEQNEIEQSFNGKRTM